jgi:hypothetical protein
MKVAMVQTGFAIVWNKLKELDCIFTSPPIYVHYLEGI